MKIKKKNIINIVNHTTPVINKRKKMVIEYSKLLEKNQQNERHKSKPFNNNPEWS
jgi:hypothetical protein